MLIRGNRLKGFFVSPLLMLSQKTTPSSDKVDKLIPNLISRFPNFLNFDQHDSFLFLKLLSTIYCMLIQRVRPENHTEL